MLGVAFLVDAFDQFEEVPLFFAEGLNHECMLDFVKYFFQCQLI